MQHMEQEESRGQAAAAALPLPRTGAFDGMDEPRVVVRMKRPPARVSTSPTSGLTIHADALAPQVSAGAFAEAATAAAIPRADRDALPGDDRPLKRILDIGLTLVLGVLGFPLIAVIWLLIKLDSKGGGLYIQERVGHRGRPFRCLKFRTMHGDGEARLESLLASDPALRAEYEEFHKLKNDPRVTRVGFWLRKYSLDELPQLWNVLRGEMSLVGPRAYLARELPEMNGKDRVILSVKPGLTGFWQVTGRNREGFRRRVARDVFYARHCNTAFDLSLLLRTVLVVIRGNGC